MTLPPPEPPPHRSGRIPMRRLVLVAALIGAGFGLAAVYGMGGLMRNGTGAGDEVACQGALETARAIEPLARGEVAAMAVAYKARRVPDVGFNRDGKPVRLADLRGRTVLLNLWATWCAPCREEMPALDELEAKLGGADFTVVALNLDTGSPSRPREFLKEIGVKNLTYFDDPSTQSFQELKRHGRGIVGLPTSLLIDRDGCEVGVLAGPAEWSSEDALALIRAAIDG